MSEGSNPSLRAVSCRSLLVAILFLLILRIIEYGGTTMDIDDMIFGRDETVISER